MLGLSYATFRSLKCISQGLAALPETEFVDADGI